MINPLINRISNKEIGSMKNSKIRKVYYKFVIILDFLFALSFCVIVVVSYVKWRKNLLLFVLACIAVLGVFSYINIQKLKKLKM